MNLRRPSKQEDKRALIEEYVLTALRLRDAQSPTQRRGQEIKREKAAAESVSGHLRGWDLTQPVFETLLDPAEPLAQFARIPGLSGLQIGNYFTLAGPWLSDHADAMSRLAIRGTEHGRMLLVFGVERATVVLEGTAAPIPTGDDDSQESNLAQIGGVGGATQLFIPDRGLSSLGAPRMASTEGSFGQLRTAGTTGWSDDLDLGVRGATDRSRSRFADQLLDPRDPTDLS